MINATPMKKRELKHYLTDRINETCRWCGINHHLPICPRVKKYSFHPDGSLAGVEFYTTEEMSWRPASPLMPTFTPTTAPMPTTS